MMKRVIQRKKTHIKKNCEEEEEQKKRTHASKMVKNGQKGTKISPKKAQEIPKKA